MKIILEQTCSGGVTTSSQAELALKTWNESSGKNILFLSHPVDGSVYIPQELGAAAAKDYHEAAE